MNKKTFLLILLIIVIIVGIVFVKTFIFYDKYKMPKNANIITGKNEFKVYETAKLYSLLDNYNVEILTHDTDLDLTTIGDHKYTIEYKFKSNFKKYLYDLNYTVIDDTDPIFVRAPSSSKTLYVNEGSNEDLTKKVSYADNYDTKPTLEIKGDINFSEVGTYKLTYIVTDSSGNQTSKNSVVTVKERPEPTENNDKNDDNKEPVDNHIYIEDQISNYKNDSTMIGIDVSKWQGEIDFEKVKNAGVEFVIIRMGVMKDKDTPLTLDKTFKDNFENAKKAGLKVGVYIFSESTTVESAIENANFVIDNLNGDTVDFPIVFDWESWDYFNSLEINLHRLNEMYDAFTEVLNKAGYKTMLYGSESYLNNTWLTLKDYDIWVAKYSTKTPSVNNKEFMIWQNSEVGKVDGINEDVDLNIYFKK